MWGKKKQNKRGGGYTPSSKFGGLLCKENVASFFGFFASFLLIFHFSNWSRFPFLFLKHNLYHLRFNFVLSILVIFMYMFFFLCDFSLQGPFLCDFLFFYSLKMASHCETICGIEGGFLKLDHEGLFSLIC